MSDMLPSHSSGAEDLLIQGPIHQLEARKKRRHQAAWAGLALLMVGSLMAVNQQGTSFMASILPIKQAPAFDGTAYPIEKAPNWVKLKSEEYKYSYEQLSSDKLLPAPIYNPENLTRTVDTLKWGNPSDDAIRNQKITYSVPYMGSYRLNGKEYDGSHLAVDIKVPRNTPVRSIANGVVTKISHATSGFGKHIVIQHTDVPSLENPSIRTTYHSSYSHLGTVLINEGDVVLRGQSIALSGDTGFATTPHIHFQVDRSEAPWHPYWPFTYQEHTAAGLDFVGAINAGLGKEKALQNTIHPMTFVQNHLTGAPILSPTSGQPTPQPVPVASPTPSPVPEPAPVPPAPVPDTNVTGGATAFTFSQKSSYQLGEEIKITITAQNEQGAPATLSEAALILLSTDIGTLSKSTLMTEDLQNGQFTVHLQNPKVGVGQVTVLYKGVLTRSTLFEIINSSTAATVAPPVTTPTPKPTPVVTAPSTTRPAIFADVRGDQGFYDAIKYVKQKGVFGGYLDGTFRPDQVISRAEVIKVALKAANRPLLTTQGSLSYSDIDPTAWYIPYIATAQQNGITNGYIGGYFRPNQDVTRAEFLKILLLASPVSIDPTVSTSPYPDVQTDDWHAVFAQFAKQKNLLPNVTNGFKPNEAIARGEVAEIIYRLLVIISSGSKSYTAELANS